MKKIILIAMLYPLNACEGPNITRDDIDVAEYVCAQTGEELYEVNAGSFGITFRCGGVEGEWTTMDNAIKQHGTTCILEN